MNSSFDKKEDFRRIDVDKPVAYSQLQRALIIGNKNGYHPYLDGLRGNVTVKSNDIWIDRLND